jgi:transposase
MAQPLFVRPLSDAERESLATRARSQTKDEAWRAKVILLSAEGRATAEISKLLGFHQSNVKKWIKKFNSEGVDGLAVRKRGPREGPKPRFTKEQVGQILELYGTDPTTLGYGFRRWTTQKLASAAIERGIVERVSHVTVRQILMRQTASATSRLTEGLVTSTKGDPLSGSPLAAGRDALSRCEFEKAAELLKRSLSESDLSVDEEAVARSLLSRALEELSRFQDAYEVVGKYEEPKALAALPQNTRSKVKLRLGWCNTWLRRNPEAIAHLNEARGS